MWVFDWLMQQNLPNWFTFIFSLVGWPLIVTWWSARKIQGIPHLNVYPVVNQQKRLGPNSLMLSTLCSIT
jgi:hypothetical protein